LISEQSALENEIQSGVWFHLICVVKAVDVLRVLQQVARDFTRVLSLQLEEIYLVKRHNLQPIIIVSLIS
jgi:hypothetical protein